MGVPGVGRGRGHVPWPYLLTPIPRDALQGGRHGGPHALGWRAPLQAGLAAMGVRGNGAERGDVALAIPGPALAMATPTALHIDAGGGVADGAHAPGALLALPGEALGLVASRVPVLRHLL